MPPTFLFPFPMLAGELHGKEETDVGHVGRERLNFDQLHETKKKKKSRF